MLNITSICQYAVQTLATHKCGSCKELIHQIFDTTNKGMTIPGVCRKWIYLTENLLLSSIFLVLEKKVFLSSLTFFLVHRNEVVFFSFYCSDLDYEHEVFYTSPRFLLNLNFCRPMIEHVLDHISIIT